MLKLIFGFIFIATTVFSEQQLEFQVKKVDNKNIEILVTGNNEPNIKIYKIQYGDTLSELALKFKNSVSALVELNNIKNKDLIITNHELKYIEKGDKKWGVI